MLPDILREILSITTAQQQLSKDELEQLQHKVEQLWRLLNEQKDAFLKDPLTKSALYQLFYSTCNVARDIAMDVTYQLKREVHHKVARNAIWHDGVHRLKAAIDLISMANIALGILEL